MPTKNLANLSNVPSFSYLELARFGPTARVWLVVQRHGTRGASYQDVAKVLCVKVPYYSKHPDPDKPGWGLPNKLGNDLPPALGRPPVYVGTYLTGVVYRMWKRGYFKLHRRKGPRGGRVYFVDSKCLIPREVAFMMWPEDNS